MRKFFCVIVLFFWVIVCPAQYNGYSLSTVSVRIYDASASVLNEIQKIPEIENRIVQFGTDISQSDFDAVCSKFKWIKKLVVENTQEIINVSSVKKLKELESLQLKNAIRRNRFRLLRWLRSPRSKNF